MLIEIVGVDCSKCQQKWAPVWRLAKIRHGVS